MVDALWRGVALLALALAPYAAPADVPAASSLSVEALRLAVSGLLLAGVALALRTLRHPLAAVPALAVVTAIILGVALPAERWPLSRAVWIMAPITWCALAVVSSLVVARVAGLALSRRMRIGISVLTLAIGAVGLAGAAPRLRSAKVLLAGNPGFEPAALEHARALEQAGLGDAANEVLRKCASSNAAACECLSRAVGNALATHRYEDVVASTQRAKSSCVVSAALLGKRAEALASLGMTDQAMKTAEGAMQATDHDAFAAYARALASRSRGEDEQAKRFARQAVGWGRGSEARVFLGVLEMQSGDLSGAEDEFQAVLESDPKNVPAAYDAALLAQTKGQYRAAREGYLHVLALDPDSVDARYNLAVLTHGIGANSEARHHADEMAKIAPADPRLAGLRTVLSEDR